ncbi:cupin domain-containing protein [Chloroflexi bacterium TSY]|nr:cupin domain-containing protein [Chloroflexi bacterium TSY]
MDSEQTPTALGPGASIRRYRKEKALTLVELAEQCELSPSFLSQIERNQANPSVTTLYAIARALDVPVASFFESNNNASQSINKEARSVADVHSKNAQVVRADSRKTLIYPGSGIRSELLSPDLQRDLQLMWIVMPPGTDTGDTPFVHEGEECGIVLKGQLETWIGDERYVLGPGDSIYHKSTIPHRSRNIGETDVVMVVSKTPPSF